MKKSFILLFTIVIFTGVNSQTLKYVNFSGGSEVIAFSYMTDQKAIIKISPDGKILEWGEDMEPGRFYSQPGRLMPYMGRVEYYGQQYYDSVIKGKVKSIGTTSITYYGSFENSALVGKVKSIGSLTFDYFNDFENQSLRGKIKSIGSKSINYYSSFENEAFKGKVKSIGGIQLTYYSTFEDVAVRGRIKSIGSFNYSWYASYESGQYRGGLKSGSIQQMIEGVTYVLW